MEINRIQIAKMETQRKRQILPLLERSNKRPLLADDVAHLHTQRSHLVNISIYEFQDTISR